MKTKPIKRRPIGKRKQWFKVTLLIVPLLTLLGYGCYQLWHVALGWVEDSSLAVLTDIEIQGNDLVTEHEVLEAASVKLGSNLMQLPLDSIALRVTELERVEVARAIRRLPGRLILKIYEREPLGAIGVGELLLVDEYGEFFHPVYGLETIDLPVLTGRNILADSLGLHAALNLLNLSNDEYPKLFASIGEVEVSHGKVRSMRLRQGGAKILVDGEITNEALHSLEVFLVQKGTDLSANTQYVDLRMPGMVITGSDPG
ncbi:cell division protein FtsQ/DivIB [Calditrichota bacterium]